jgi:hydrogenase expression/formation protein HypC
MCLSVPMRIVSIEGVSARCEARGVERLASLWLLQHETLQPGDHVLVHLGQAVRKVDAEEAAASWALFDELLAMDAPFSASA